MPLPHKTDVTIELLLRFSSPPSRSRNPSLRVPFHLLELFLLLP